MNKKTFHLFGKKKFIIIILSTLIIIFQINNNNSIENDINTASNTIKESSPILQEKIELYDLDGKEKNYTFTYKNEEYSATYTKDNWHVNNSYKITILEDIIIICQALIEIHPIHGKDMVSYRTAEDLANEWLQHNFAYELLPNENSWKENAKHVDLNPEDQGKSLEEFYKERAHLLCN